MSQTAIEVFRDLSIVSERVKHNDIRALLLAHKAKDWPHAKEQEDKLRKYASGDKDEDVVVFSYAGSKYPSADITLWQRDNGYAVTNIVPTEFGQLDIAQYNNLLGDFVEQVVNKANSQQVLQVRMSEAIRQLDSWTSEGAAKALRSFSLLANKSTTNSHPSDAARWEDFVIQAHRSKTNPPADILMRWLIEVDGWDYTSANKLAIDYEGGISLLEAYDACLGN